MLAAVEYERLAVRRPTFKDYLARGPSFEGLDLDRDPGPGRDVGL